MLSISIPCTYENKILTVKSLGMEGKGDSPDQALLGCIENTPYFTGLILAKFKSFKDHRDRQHMHLEIPFDALIFDLINELEPYPNDKLKKKRSQIVEPDAEDVVRLGY